MATATIPARIHFARFFRIFIIGFITFQVGIVVASVLIDPCVQALMPGEAGAFAGTQKDRFLRCAFSLQQSELIFGAFQHTLLTELADFRGQTAAFHLQVVRKTLAVIGNGEAAAAQQLCLV